MRVVHVVTAFPRHAADPITPWLVELVRRQRAAGIDAFVLAPAYRGGPPSGASGAGTAGIPVERFRYAPAALETLTHDETVPDRLRRRPLQALLVPFYLLGGLRAVRRIGGRRGPGGPLDVVHVHWPMPHALLGAAMRRASGGRTAVVCSYYSVEIHWIRSRLRPLLPFLRWTVGTADAVTAISSSTAAAVRSLVDRPVDVIPYGAAMADEGEPPLREALSRRADDPVRILFVGRLVERKGVEVLVRALGVGARDGFSRPVELRIVGAGEWEGRIRDSARDAGLAVVVDGREGRGRDVGTEREGGSEVPHSEHRFSGSAGNLPARETPEGAAPARVRFLGRLSDEVLRREYEEADMLVLPAVRDSKGDTEGLGVVLLEALRFERPVIGSDIGGIPDIVRHEETGLLVTPGDEHALAAAIARLIDDPVAARHLARRGRARSAAAFGWEGVVAATTDAYRRAIEARAAAR